MKEAEAKKNSSMNLAKVGASLAPPCACKCVCHGHHSRAPSPSQAREEEAAATGAAAVQMEEKRRFEQKLQLAEIDALIAAKGRKVLSGDDGAARDGAGQLRGL